MWHFVFALFRFWAILVNFRFLIFSALSQTLGNFILGLSEAEKLAGSGGKNHPIISSGTDFRGETKKNIISLYIYIYIYTIYIHIQYIYIYNIYIYTYTVYIYIYIYIYIIHIRHGFNQSKIIKYLS